MSEADQQRDRRRLRRARRPVRARRRDDPPDRRLPQRCAFGARGLQAGRAARAGRPRDAATRDRRDAPGEDRGAGHDRRDPGAGEAAREVPARPGGDDQAARASGPSAPGGCTRSSGSTRSRACARRLRQAGSASSRASAPRPSRRCSRRWTPYAQAGPAQRIVLSRALAVGEELLAEIRALPVDRPGRARRLGAAHGRERQGPRHRRHGDRSRRAGRGGGGAAAGRGGLDARAPTPSGSAPTAPSTSTCGSSSRTSSATCCSTSPAPSSTTWRCATSRCAAGCTSPNTGCSTTAPATPTAAPTEAEVYALLGMEYIPPELREDRGELEAALKGDAPRSRHRRRPQGRSALSHDGLRRHRLDRGDGRRRRSRPDTSTSAITDHSASMGFGADVSDDQLQRADRARSGDRRDAARVHAAGRLGGQHPARRLARLPRRAAGRARLGRGQRSHLVPDAQGGDDRRASCARSSIPYVDCIGHLSGRKILQRRARTSSTSTRVLEAVGAHRHDVRDQRQPRPPRPQRGACARRRGGRHPDRDQLRRPPHGRLRGGALRRRDRAAGLAQRRPRSRILGRGARWRRF